MLSLCLDLGIVNVAVLRTALQQDGHTAFALGVGSTVGDLVYFTMAVLGAATLTAWPPFRFCQWVFGSGTLFWLAWKMIRAVLHPRPPDLSESASHMNYGSANGRNRLGPPPAVLWFAAVGGREIASSATQGKLWRTICAALQRDAPS